VRAITYKPSWADADQSTSTSFELKRIVQTPYFTYTNNYVTGTGEIGQIIPTGAEQHVEKLNTAKCQSSPVSPQGGALTLPCGFGGGTSLTHTANIRVLQWSVKSVTATVTHRYTVNGNNPTAHVPSGTSTVPNDRSSWQKATGDSVTVRDTNDDSFHSHHDYVGQYTVRAITFKPSWADSDVGVSTTFHMMRILQTPYFTPDGGTHAANIRTLSFSVTNPSIATATNRYTVNGGAPNAQGTYPQTYSTPPKGGTAAWTASTKTSVVANTGTFNSHVDYHGSYIVRAISYKSTWADSNVAVSKPFDLKRIVQTPYFAPNGGSYASTARSLRVTLGTKTLDVKSAGQGAVLIKYTTDMQDPNPYVGMIYNASGHTFGMSAQWGHTKAEDPAAHVQRPNSWGTVCKDTTRHFDLAGIVTQYPAVPKLLSTSANTAERVSSVYIGHKWLDSADTNSVMVCNVQAKDECASICAAVKGCRHFSHKGGQHHNLTAF
jgi:hypothetical protein